MLQPSHNTIGGKISIITALLGVSIILAGLFVDLPHGHIANANVATTSVTVLNTPPQYVTDVQESPASSTTTPTNAGSAVTFIVTATDSSGDNYYLLICKTQAAPTPTDGGAPECNGGSGNRWARSASTATGVQASAATTTVDTVTGGQFNNEINSWYGYICDGASTGAACNAAMSNGIPSAGAMATASSPFVVNHRPVFTTFVDNSPLNPGQLVTWYATATDVDTYGGFATDTLTLFVCKAADFTGTACGAGGTWTSGYASPTDPTASTTISNPFPDATYASYGYIIDTHGSLAPTGGAQGSNSVFVVNNMTPTIAAASVTLLDTDQSGPLTLSGMATQTAGFSVQFTVTDQNSCYTSGGSPTEIAFASTSVYRSAITQAVCSKSQNYNANNCYPYGAATTSIAWNMTCTASSTSCINNADSDVIWSCTFPLWYIADATDAGSFYAAQNWLASAIATDNNASSSSFVESTTGTELSQYLAYNVATTTIQYGSLQPGNSTVNVGDTALKRTGLQAVGNVGIDETLYGTDMCPTYPTCTGNATSTIFITNQHYASSSVVFASATALVANPGASFLLHVPKSTSTTTPSQLDTYWGILVPGAITISGDYTGVNTLIAFTSPSSTW